MTRESESIILPKRRAFYPAHIPVQHWQLRQLLSAASSHPRSPSSTLVYYASDVDVYCLDTATCIRERVVTLPFVPRCIAADNGWVCAGGDINGQFAAVQLCNGPSDDSRSHRQNAEVDSLLPLDFSGYSEMSRRTLELIQSQLSRNNSSRDCYRHTPILRTQDTGESIVNSVTIHGCEDRERWIHGGPIAIITNNDMTVKIYHLPTFTLLHKISFEVPMNHASVSPNGELLVAVGDRPGEDPNANMSAPVVYFLRKQFKDAIVKGANGSSKGDFDLPYGWVFCHDNFDIGMDSCFCSTFSPTGNFCAIGSQDSRIVVYDMRLIEAPARSPIVAVFHSSQPGQGAGAVRSLTFLRGPWDLLAWTEHTGRAGIADARDGFLTRQYIDLRHDPEVARIVNVQDEYPLSEDQSIDPQLREDEDLIFHQRYRRYLAQGDAAAARFAADYSEASAERRRLQRQRHSEDASSDFTEREREILNTLRLSSYRTLPEDRDHRAFSINYRPPRQTSVSNRDSVLENAEAYINSTQNNSTPQSISTPQSSSTPQTAVDEGNLRSEQQQEHDTTSRQILELSRSTFRSRAGGRLGGVPSDTSPSERGPQTSLMGPHNGNSSDPWRTIEAAMANSPFPESVSRIRREQRDAEMDAIFRQQLVYQQQQQQQSRRQHLQQSQQQHVPQLAGVRSSEELIAQLERERSHETQSRLVGPPSNDRDRLRLLEARLGTARRLRHPRQYRQTAIRMLRADGEETEHPTLGPDTSGCAVSPDGRFVHFAVEAGILQVEINTDDRRFFPKLDPI